MLLRRYRDGQRGGIGDQFIGWGAVDGLIAVFGMASMHHNARRLAQGEIDPEKHVKDARRFEQIVWVNTALDIGYMVAGGSLVQRNREIVYRRGTGWGIFIQGSFLFFWDLLLGLLIRSYRHGRHVSS